MIKRFADEIRGFNDDEAGMEAVQVVMILAIAALAFFLAKPVVGRIIQFFNAKTQEDFTNFG